MNATIYRGVYSLISIVNPGMKTLKRNIFICLSYKVSQNVPNDNWGHTTKKKRVSQN